MTYGWALILIVIAFSGMMYFGLFDTDKYVATTCVMDGSLSCPIFNLNMVNDSVYLVDMQLVNNLDERINVTKFSFRLSQTESFCSTYVLTDLYDDPLQGTIAGKGGKKDFRFVFRDGTNCSFTNARLFDGIDKKSKYDIELFYIPRRATVPSAATGEIVGIAKFNGSTIPGNVTGGGYTCSETDGGMDFNTSGATTDYWTTNVDSCNTSTQWLTEWYCTASPAMSSTQHFCEPGTYCLNNHCEPTTTLCTKNDSSSPYTPQYFLGGQTKDALGVGIDDCLDATTLREYYCFTNTSKTYEDYVCDTYCNETTNSCFAGCYDTDDGLDIYVKGSIYNNGSLYATDACQGDLLTEWFCSTDLPSSNELNCSDEGMVCSDGACKAAGASCLDSDAGPNNYTIAGNVTDNSEIKYDYCQSTSNLSEYYCDPVNDEWKLETIACEGEVGSGYECESGKCVFSGPQTCFDSDGGINSGSYGETFVDEVFADADECVNIDELTEYYCNIDNDSVSTTILCSATTGYFCNTETDQCEEEPIQTCVDSDPTDDPKTYGFTQVNGSFADADYCPGPDDTKLKQASCDVDNNSIYIEYDCTELGLNYVCASGECKELAVSCVDNDAGPDNYTTASTVTYGAITHDDACSDPNALVEWYCDGSFPASQDIKCADFGYDGCFEGACLPPACPSGGVDVFDDGNCWYDAPLGTSCTDHCQDLSLKCDTGNWNDDDSCKACRTFFSLATGCQTNSALYLPGFSPVANSCYTRTSFYEQGCSSSASAIQRLCVCYEP